MQHRRHTDHSPETGWEWDLPAGRARRVRASAGPRWLQVTAGRLWFTATSAEGADNPDRWVAAGERLWLPAGSEWVAEGDGLARYTLLEAPTAAVARQPSITGFAGVSWATASVSALRAWARRWSLTRVPSVCV